MPVTDKQTLSQKIDRVLYILENDDKTKRKGLVEDVADMKITLEDLVLQKKMFAAKVTLLGVIGGFLFSILVWAYDKIIIK
jgi:hypothetical protein